MLEIREKLAEARINLHSTGRAWQATTRTGPVRARSMMRWGSRSIRLCRTTLR